jgi:hypothetical protein
MNITMLRELIKEMHNWTVTLDAIPEDAELTMEETDMLDNLRIVSSQLLHMVDSVLDEFTEKRGSP